MLHADVSGYKG